MTYVIDTALIILLFTLFALSHSLLANTKIKNRIAQRVGKNFAFYRAFYNLTSLLFFIFILDVAPHPDLVIYDLHFPYDITVVVLQIINIIGLIWSVKVIDIKEFLGLNQIKKFLEGDFSEGDSDDKSELIIRGPFKYSRHPLYFFLYSFWD
ncbi:MAG: hypothetical protein PVH88_23255 [Ignavibacteria bacterium]|jgi:steroid 5-alpha reductase family enzyme